MKSIYRFRDIALALMGPRRSGRSHEMLKTAPRDTVVFAADDNHAKQLRSMATVLGREDLRFYVPTDIGVQHQQGPFVFDHYTIERLLMDADGHITDLMHQGAHKTAVIESNARVIADAHNLKEAAEIQREDAYKEIAKMQREINETDSRHRDELNMAKTERDAWKERYEAALRGLAWKAACQPAVPIIVQMQPEKSDAFRDAKIKMLEAEIELLKKPVLMQVYYQPEGFRAEVVQHVR